MTNNTNESIEIVELQPHPAAVADRLGNLLTLVRDISFKRIQVLIKTLFENVDDALFDLAGKADSNSIQTEYFDSMRDVRNKRQRVACMLQKLLSNTFNNFAEGGSPAKSESPRASHVDLELIDDLELEESLAIASMVAKAESRLASQLYAANQRISMLRGGAVVENANNPIAPALLCQSFRLAMHEFDLNNRVRLLIYKLFDRYVMAGLGAMYDEVNANLVRSGVLPQIHYSAYSAPNGRIASIPIPPNAQTEFSLRRDNPIGAHLQDEIYNTVRSLLASRHLANAADVERSNYLCGLGVQGAVPTELLTALRFLQHQAMLAQKHASPAANAAQMVQQIKQELLDQADKIRDDGKMHVAAADEDTIDLVGMLFEFVLQDRNLLAPMQVLLGRLQIPFLKVALLDKHLFAQKNHPARQLLDSMAHACMGWSEESDRDHVLHSRVKLTVESLLEDVGEDASIFERTRVDFENFLEANKKRAEHAEQRAAQATHGREKLLEARRISAREILKCVDGKQLPDIIYNVLTRPWANYLALMLLRQGEDSDEWRHALQFADAFAWSGEPKTSAAERDRLMRLLPELERGLRGSLGTVAYHDADLEQLWHELNSFYSTILKDTSMPPEPSQRSNSSNQNVPESLPASTAAAAVESAVEETVSCGKVEDTTPECKVVEDDVFLEQARALKIGRWLEFSGPDSTIKQRAKLSWISPISEKYLFVNRAGLKVSDKTVIALASEIRSGATLILEDSPLFDRALDSIIKHLSQAE